MPSSEYSRSCCARNTITRDCENPELAAQWIDFYINNRQANEIMGVDRGMPVNGIMVDAVWDQLSADDRESIAYVREMVEPASSTINPPSPAKAVIRVQADSCTAVRSSDDPPSAR